MGTHIKNCNCGEMKLLSVSLLLLVLGVLIPRYSTKSVKKVQNLNSLVKKVKDAVLENKNIGDVGDLLSEMEEAAKKKEQLLLGYRMFLGHERRKNLDLMDEIDQKDVLVRGYRIHFRILRNKMKKYKAELEGEKQKDESEV